MIELSTIILVFTYVRLQLSQQKKQSRDIRPGNLYAWESVQSCIASVDYQAENRSNYS